MANADNRLTVPRRSADIAYGCYLWVALVLVTSAIFGFVYGDPDTAEELARLQGIGMLVILPLSLSALLAAAFGLKASAKLYKWWLREAGLIVLPILLLALLVVFLLAESKIVGNFWQSLAAAVYAVCAFWFSLRWFFRRRHLARA